MSNRLFKLTTLAGLILGATSANAALYKIVEVSSQGAETYGSAIQDSGTDTSCFSRDCIGSDTYKVAGDTLQGFEGFSYRQEVPYGVDNRFYYVDQDDLENYCDDELGYSTCEKWAYNQWFGFDGVGGLYRERQAWNLGTYESNASAFLDNSSVNPPDSPLSPTGFSSVIANSKNTVVNGLDGTTVIGNTSSGYFSNGSNAALMFRERGFYGSTLLQPKQSVSTIVTHMGRTMAFDSFTSGSDTYVVGSASVAAFNNDDDDKNYLGDLSPCDTYSDPATYAACQNFAFATKPYLWNVTSGGATATGIAVTGWDSTVGGANEGDYAAQGSVRAAVVPDSGTYQDKPILVGYNTYEYSSRYLMQAAVFYPVDSYTTVAENAWDTVFITDATVRIDGEYIHSNSVAKDINDNLMVIGESKRYGNKPESGAANNRLFIADASSGSPTASYFSGGIFFSGAGGEANSINNYNEVVGQIDAETNREINGKQRRRRAYIYPYSGTDDEARRAIFNNKAWWIDNLTNGGTYSASNNQYRVINAADINDAGVITATALKCASGQYDTTSHNSYCGGGSGTEEIVAVKLIPIQGATSADIEERVADSTTVSRKGGSLGIFALTLLGLISFRRKR
jgi:hypothetical protein